MTVSDVVGLSQDGVQLTDEQAQALDTLTAAADKYGTTIQGVAEASEENGLFGGIENAQNGIAAAAQQMETISQNIDNIQSAYKACTTAMEEYNKYGYMSADALQGLLSMNDEYLACLDVVDGKLQINNDRYADLIAAQYTEAEATAIEQAMHELEALQADDTKKKTEDLTTATEEQQTALENAVPAIQNATTATGQLAIALATANSAAEGDADMQAKIDTITNALNTRLTAIHTNMQAAINSGAAVRNQLKGFDKDSKNSGKTGSKSVTDVASAFDTLTKAMKEYNQYGYMCADTAKSLVGLDDKFTACLTKQGNKLQINVEQFRKFVKEQLKEANAAKDGGKSADEMNKILNYLDQNVDTTTISFEQLTDAIKGYGTAMADAKEKTDAIKSAFSGLSEVMNNKTDRNNPFGLLDSDDVEKQHDALMQLAKDTNVFKSKAYNPETGEVDFNSKAFKDSVVEYLNGMADAAAQTGGAGAKAIEKNWRDAAKAIADGRISVEEFYNGLGYSLEKATKEIDDFQSGFSDITDIVDADTYVSVRYGSNPVKVRGKRGQTYEIQCPIAAMNDTEVYVYNASIIQSIGDISGFYPGYVDFSHGVKLTDLKIGSAAEGYKNTNMTDFAVGNNTLLEHLNLQNVPNLKKSISLTGCTNLEEFYAGGSGITGVAFAKGGKIRKAELPAIASLSAKNLNYLTDLKITDYKNITTLTVEKCPTIDLTDMLAKCTNLNRVRLTGINWQLDDTSLLDRLLKIYDRDNAIVYGTSSGTSTGYHPVIGQKTPSGAWTIGTYSDERLIFDYTTDANKTAGTNNGTQVYLPAQAGTIITSATIGSQSVNYANSAGNATNAANATTATKLSSNAGSSVQPVYFSGGKPVAIGYTISSSVPANAKFTDTTYGVASSSSNGLMSSTDKTKLDDFSRVISIQKQIKLTTDWLDTGIAGNSLDTGTYVVQVSGFNSSYTQLYSEIYSGVMSWYSGTTNSGNSSEIFLHNAGLADNNNAIYLRTLRVAGSKTLKLQIACKVAATGTDILTFKFRRLI